jgi:hypothetical protein
MNIAVIGTSRKENEKGNRSIQNISLAFRKTSAPISTLKRAMGCLLEQATKRSGPRQEILRWSEKAPP